MFEILFLLLGTVLLFRWSYGQQVRQGARALKEDLETTFGGRHELASVDSALFRDLVDLSFYDELTAVLLDFDFAWVCDLEDLTLSRRYPALRTFTRCMTDGTTRAGFSHIRPRGMWMRMLARIRLIPAEIRMVELITEFGEGRIVATNNAEATNPMDQPPEFDTVQLAEETPLTELLGLHRRRVGQYLERHPEEEVRPVVTAQEMLDAVQRNLLILSRFRQKVGFSAQELERLGGSKETARDLARELEKQRREGL